MSNHKVLKFAKVKISTEPPTDAEATLVSCADEHFEKVAVLGQDADGYWYFRCSAGIKKVTLIGMMEFIKMDIFDSMGP